MDWKKIVGTLAPTVATALGTPALGFAVSTLCSVFGLDSSETDEDALHGQIAQAVARMSPEQALALKQADKAFLVQMKKLNIDVFKLATEDKHSARLMYSKDGLENKIPQITLGSLILIGSFSLFYFVLAGDINASVDKILIGTIIGACISELKQLTSFYFGSSVKEKAEVVKG